MYKILSFLVTLVMFNDVVAEPYDLNILPEVDPESANHRIVTLGDMHGNVKKICWSLLRAGAITMSEQDYAELVDLYNNWLPNLYFDLVVSFPQGACVRALEPIPGLSLAGLAADKHQISSNIQKFKTLLTKIKCSKRYQVRFLGDMLADRGKCDYLTLLLIEYLQRHLDIVIIESNHDAVLQDNLIGGLDHHEHDWSHYACSYHNASMYGLKVLLDFGIIELAEVVTLLDAYNKHVKLIDYELTHDRSQLILFMHAPNNFLHLLRLIGLLNHWLKHADNISKETKLLKKITLNLDEIFTDKSVLMRAIDEINRLFTYLYFEKKLPMPDEIGALLNNRGSPDLNCFKQNTVALLVHGHVGELGYNYPLCLNLDANIGKVDRHREPNEWQDFDLRYTPKHEITRSELGVPMLFTNAISEPVALTLPPEPEVQWVSMSLPLNSFNLPAVTAFGWFV